MTVTPDWTPDRTPDWTHDASAFAELLGSAAASLASSPVRSQSCVRLPARGRLLVTGDIHDNAVHFEAAIRAARLGASPDRHLVLQEIIHGEGAADGVDRSHRLLARVAELVLAHPGQVHPILANHELAQCRGHAIQKGGVDCTAAFDRGLGEAFGAEAPVAARAVARFIQAMPLAVVCANGALVAHSLPSPSMMRYFDVRVLERPLFDEDFDPPLGAAFLMTWGRSHGGAAVGFGPTGGSMLESLAREWRVRAFIVGHEPAPDGAAFRAPNMVILNTGHPEGRVIDLDLGAPCPSAEALASGSIPIVAYIPDGPSGGAPGFGLGDGARA